uniref:Uncharacterized LOC109511143 n=1 Tax=Hippocampus comes TaxID=109280 RepID=A0A3Q2YB44_HIPCM
MTTIHHLWILLVIHSVFVCGDIQFLERQEGDSVDLPCTIKPRSRSPLGFYMRRTWLHPGQVLFKYTGTEAHVNVAADRRRLEIGGDPSSHSLTVTLSDLRANDTDRYYCEFVVANPSSEDEHVPGETEFFLLVNPGGPCGCSSYPTLLYALSSAVLVLIVLLALILIYHKRARSRAASRPPAPIYEEMTGVKTFSAKPDDTEVSEYRNCKVKKNCPENHYETPIRSAF